MRLCSSPCLTSLMCFDRLNPQDETISIDSLDIKEVVKGTSCQIDGYFVSHVIYTGQFIHTFSIAEPWFVKASKIMSVPFPYVSKMQIHAIFDDPSCFTCHVWCISNQNLVTTKCNSRFVTVVCSMNNIVQNVHRKRINFCVRAKLF